MTERSAGKPPGNWATNAYRSKDMLMHIHNVEGLKRVLERNTLCMFEIAYAAS